MTKVDARNASSIFDMSDGEMVDRASELLNSPTLYLWETSGGDGIAASRPVGTLVTTLLIDLDYVAHAGNDATITPGVPVTVSNLTSPGGTDAQVAADKFWTALLAGDDRLLAPVSGRGFMFGDFLNVYSDGSAIENLTGGDDVFIAAPTGGGGIVIGIGSGSGRGGSGPWLVGDAFNVEGSDSGGPLPIAYEATLTGGRDTFRQTKIAAYDFAGDAMFVGTLGHVIGGDDDIRSDGTVATLGRNVARSLIGDVVVNNGGLVDGGDDDVTGSDYSFLSEFLSGDVWQLRSGGVNGGDDSVSGRGGHDFIAGDAILASDLLTGGDDTLRGGDDADIVAGDALQVGTLGPFGDIGANATVPATVVCGDDDISGDDGADILAGDVYAVTGLSGGSSIAGGRDDLSGGAGRDRLFGDFGDGGGGSWLSNGVVSLSGGRDNLDGGDGNDFLAGQFGRDVINGGDGNDTADYSEKTSVVRVTLDGATAVSVMVAGVAEDTIRNVESINGGSRGDRLTGDAANNHLDGNGGEDVLSGGDGSDELSGGGDSDDLTGGGGGDTFLFDAALGDGTFDTITDFSGNDRIHLDSGVFAALSAGELASGRFFKGAGANAAHDANDRIIYDTVTGKLYYDADGMNGQAAELFARLSGHPTLNASDILIV